MKLACASGALDRSFELGDVTQLEFLDRCARDLRCDGVVLDVRHFPRTDSDYLAQIKKLATDRGLTIAALSDARFFSAGSDEQAATIEWAVALGAPVISGPLAGQTAMAWTQQLEHLAQATGAAKRANVTLAVRNAPHTWGDSVAACKRAAKEADSAWLRFAPDPGAFGPSDDAAVLLPSAVLVWRDASEPAWASIATSAFIGFVAVDDRTGTASFEELAEILLNRI
jgi:sugar phosphate isomerase/epimerase